MSCLLRRTGDPDEVFNVIKFADQMGFDTAGFPITRCGAGITGFSVLPDGSTYPCVKREPPRHRICNLLSKDGVSLMRQYRQKVLASERVSLKPHCRECGIRHACGGGCRAEEVDGAPLARGCEYFFMAKKFYEQSLRECYER